MTTALRGERQEERKRTATAEEITYERVFVVQTDDPDIGPRAVSFCAGLPLFAATYATETEDDPLCKVSKRDAEPLSRTGFWEVRISYSSKQTESEDEEEDPLTEPPEVSITHAVRMKAIYVSEAVAEYTGGGNPPRVNAPVGAVLTSAGEAFDPPAEDEEYYPILTVTRNEANVDMARIRQYVGCVNVDNWLGANPRQVKCAGIDVHKVFKKGFNYWRVTYVFEFNEDTWDLQLLDHGTFYIDQANGEKHLFVTDDEPPQPRLGLLDGKGGPLADGAQAVFRRFLRRRERVLAVFNLEAQIFG